mgnify:CR=1 FL=1
MKRIINGRLYDTDTAKEIGWYDNGFGGGDFRYYYESLYRKRTGEYFLYGSGGPMSKYSESYGSTTSGISEIIPFTEGEAMEWAVKHMDADSYMEIFGAVEE